jgi:hypothetical protein
MGLVVCGFRVLFNAKSLPMHVNEGHDIESWTPPASGVREVNAFRRSFGIECLALPLV